MEHSSNKLICKLHTLQTSTGDMFLTAATTQLLRAMPWHQGHARAALAAQVVCAHLEPMLSPFSKRK